MKASPSLNEAWARRRRGAVVLCGGQSRRMGEDKAWLPVGNEAMLTRVVSTVAKATPASNIVVVASADQALPPLPEHVRIVRDAEAFRGPMPAIIAGMNSLLEVADEVFVTSCDVPLLRSDVVYWLFWRFDQLCQNLNGAAAAARPIEAVVPRDQHRWYPLTAVYHVTARVGFSASLAQDNGSLQHAIRSGLVCAAPIGLEDLRTIDPELNALLNCNTWYDYKSALERATE